ncbi:MAG TPA: helix-turn-helix transcriptional regulator [Thermoanaerobaculia bacterium]|nr:helix-turn-helix transcriptional regulator [Thermoanaerobaculia bacterium]
MEDKDLGRALEVLRIARGWTQDELSRAAEMRGSSISRYESGKELPDADAVRRLVAALGFAPDAVERTRRFLAGLRGEKEASEKGGASEAEAPSAQPGEAERLEAEIDGVVSDLGRVLRELARRPV